jgi:hypothetical protein
MKQAHLLAIGFVSAVSAVPAMASDDNFRALEQLSMKPAALAEDRLAATEGGLALPDLNLNLAVQTVVQPVTAVQLNIAAGVFGTNPLQGNWLSVGVGAGTSVNQQR